MGERCLLRGSRHRQSFIQIYFLVAALEHGFLGAADVYVYPISCMETSHLSLPGIKGFCGTQNYQLKHVKSQANCAELFTQPELVASYTLHPTSWVESDWSRPKFPHPRDWFWQGRSLHRFNVRSQGLLPDSLNKRSSPFQDGLVFI